MTAPGSFPAIYWNNLLAIAQANNISPVNTGLRNYYEDAPDHPIANIQDWREYLTWKSSSAAWPISFRMDCGSAQSASTLIIYGHNLIANGNIGNVVVQYSDNEVDYTPIATGTLVSDAYPFILTWASASHQYWRIDMPAGTTPCTIPFVFLGEPLQFDHYMQQNFDPDDREVVVETGKSEMGFLTGQIKKYTMRTLTVGWPRLSDTFLTTIFNPFYDAHIPKPFLWAWDLQNHPQQIFLVSMSDFKRSEPLGQIWRSLSFNITGRIA